MVAPLRNGVRRMNINATMEYKKAIDYIFDKIKTGEFVIGSKLPSERDLAEQLGIGRNSTREAISILRGIGLVESRHGSGNYISCATGSTIKSIVSVLLALGRISKKDMVAFRRVISDAVGDLLFENGLTLEEQQYLRRLVDGMKEAAEAEFISLDKEFHLSLIRFTKNPLFITVMEPIGEVYLEMVSDVVSAVAAEDRLLLAETHEGILDSIICNDRDKCTVFVKRHHDFVENSFLR